MKNPNKYPEYKNALIRPDRRTGCKLTHTVIYKNKDGVDFVQGYLSFKGAKQWIDENLTNGVINN